MKNKNVTWKITQGMYVLTTENGGCVVDAVSQVSAGDNPLISVAVMKKNYTNELLKNNTKFAISILSNDVNPEIIKTFGFNSARDINKFERTETKCQRSQQTTAALISGFVCFFSWIHVLFLQACFVYYTLNIKFISRRRRILPE